MRSINFPASVVMDESEMKRKSVEEVGAWLKEESFGDGIVKLFQGKDYQKAKLSVWAKQNKIASCIKAAAQLAS